MSLVTNLTRRAAIPVVSALTLTLRIIKIYILKTSLTRMQKAGSFSLLPIQSSLSRIMLDDTPSRNARDRTRVACDF